MSRSESSGEVSKISEDAPLPPSLQPGSTQPLTAEPEPMQDDEEEEVNATLVEPSTKNVDARTRLLENYHHNRVCGLKDCNHGTFSPRGSSLISRSSTYGMSGGHGGRLADTIGEDGGPRDSSHGLFGDSITDIFTRGKSNSTTKWLADKHGVKSTTMMYLSYYIPSVKWIRQYQWSWFRGDLIAAFTMASFYIPMSLSYASNLGHIPPVNGLYSFVFNPLVYALLGTCPQMVVGPEAAGSLLLGSVVRSSIDRNGSGEDNNVLNAQIAGVVTTTAGAVILVAGLTRLGFLDSVLSRPFLRGFISAIGFVIFVDQAIPELGLDKLAKGAGVSHGSSAQKMVFLFQNLGKSHGLTAAVSWGSFAIIMVFR